MNYYGNGLLREIKSSGSDIDILNSDTTFQYDQASRRTTTTKDTYDATGHHVTGTSTTTVTYNHNGWIGQQNTTETGDDQSTLTMTTNTTDNSGLPLTQSLTIKTKDAHGADSIAVSYLGLESTLRSQTVMKAQNSDDSVTAMTYYDANGYIEGVAAYKKDDPTIKEGGVCLSSTDGRIVQARSVVAQLGIATFTTPQNYIYIDNHLVGLYLMMLDTIQKQFLILPALDLDIYPVTESFPPPAPSQYAVMQKESFTEISDDVYGEPNDAEQIAQANGYHVDDTPPIGTTLTIPNDITTNEHNQVGDFPVINPDQLYGDDPYQYLPIHLTLDHPKHLNFFATLLEVVIGVAALAIEGPLFSAFLNYMPSILAAIASGEITGVVSNLADQAALMVMGDEKELSMGAALSAGLTEAETAGISSAIGINVTNLAFGRDLPYTVEKTVEFNLINEGVQVALGQQKSYSWRDVVAQAASATANVAMNTGFAGLPPTATDGFAEDTIRNVTDEVIVDEVDKKSLKGSTIAAQALGTTIGHDIGQKIQAGLQQSNKPNQSGKTYKQAMASQRKAAYNSQFNNDDPDVMSTNNPQRKNGSAYSSRSSFFGRGNQTNQTVQQQQKTGTAKSPAYYQRQQLNQQVANGSQVTSQFNSCQSTATAQLSSQQSYIPNIPQTGWEDAAPQIHFKDTPTEADSTASIIAKLKGQTPQPTNIVDVIPAIPAIPSKPLGFWEQGEHDRVIQSAAGIAATTGLRVGVNPDELSPSDRAQYALAYQGTRAQTNVENAESLGMSVLDGVALAKTVLWNPKAVGTLISSVSGLWEKASDDIISGAENFKAGTDIVEETARSIAAKGVDNLEQFLSPKEWAAYLRNPLNGSRFLGQAVHNGTAAILEELYGTRFIYSRIGPDFFDTETGEIIELTTFKAVPAHEANDSFVNFARYELPKPRI